MSSIANSHPWTATGQEPQVFLDPSGRRARLLRPLVTALAALVLCGPVALVAGATGFASLPSVVQVVGSASHPTVAVAPIPRSAGAPHAARPAGRSQHRRSPSPSRRTIVAWKASTKHVHARVVAASKSSPRAIVASTKPSQRAIVASTKRAHRPGSVRASAAGL
jgi:hypothetical protein